MAKKRKKAKGGKRLKQGIIVPFFDSADDGKFGKPIMIWKSKNPRCFRKTNAAAKRDQVSSFSNPKSCMQVYIMENILEQLTRGMKIQSRCFMLFLDNTTVHPENLIGKYSNINTYIEGTRKKKNFIIFEFTF